MTAVRRALAALCLMLVGACAAHDAPAPSLSATFETTEGDRRAARERGQPVLLGGSVPLTPAGAAEGGWVTVDMLVGPDGRVHEVAVVEASAPSLQPAAVAAVRDWRFEPPATATRVVHTVRFPGPREDHYQPTGQER